MELKNLILREAMELFFREGISPFTEPDLQRKLDISPATYAGFFSSKEDLFKQAVKLKLTEDITRQKSLLGKAQNPVEEILFLIQDGLDELKKVGPKFFPDLLTNYPGVWKLYETHIEHHSFPQVQEILNKGVKEGYFRQELNIPIVARVIMENLNVLLNTKAFPPDKISTREVFRSIYLYYVRGICDSNAMKLTDSFFSR